MYHLTDFQKGYLAAMIDGEGCIYMTKIGNKQCKLGYSYRIGVDICNTNKSIIDYIHSFAGGNIALMHRAEGERRKPLYRLRFNTTETKPLLEEIAPYLRGKQKQALHMVSYINIFNGRTIYPEELHDAVADLKDKFRERMTKLNAKWSLTTPAAPLVGIQMG